MSSRNLLLSDRARVYAPVLNEVMEAMAEPLPLEEFNDDDAETMYFAAVDGTICQTLCRELKALDEKAGPEEGLSAFMLDVDKVV